MGYWKIQVSVRYLQVLLDGLQDGSFFREACKNFCSVRYMIRRSWSVVLCYYYVLIGIIAQWVPDAFLYLLLKFCGRNLSVTQITHLLRVTASNDSLIRQKYEKQRLLRFYDLCICKYLWYNRLRKRYDGSCTEKLFVFSQ